VEQQSKQAGESKRKKDPEPASGPSNGAHDFAPELASQVTTALEAEKVSLEKGIDAWKKVVSAAPAAWPPRRELARVYKKAERWNAYIEVLKDGLDKATWAHPEDKVPVLLEMVEVYRDRLKLDVMVVNAFNQILTLQPGNAEAADALAAQYEQMKRWPDLISLLRKKASVALDPAEKVALQLRVANLFIEKFSNQAEAIKAFETVLEIDPDHAQALTFLKQMYEKRRDWDKLIAVHQREIGRIADVEERRGRRIEVAKLASEKLKKPSLSIELWKQLLVDDPENIEAMTELEKLFEREKAWTELGDILERQVAAAGGDVGKQSPLLVKLGVLYSEKVTAPEKAVAAWRALLLGEPENRRAQDSLKKLYLQQRDWDSLEQFYAAQGKWDELVRVLERQAETEADSARIGLWTKIGEIYRDRLAKSDKAQKAFEKALALDPRNLIAAEALIPIYEKLNAVGSLTEVLRVQLEHTQDFEQRQLRTRRLGDLLAIEAGDPAGALEVSLQAFAENPAGVWGRENSAHLATQSGNWGALAEVFETHLPELDDPAARLPILSILARAYEKELANPELAIERNQEILKLSPQDEDAVGALERLYIATGRFAQLLAVYDTKLAMAKSSAAQLEIRFKLASLYEDEIKEPKKAIELYQAILAQDVSQLPALQALDRIYLAAEQWPELALTLEREIALSSQPAQIAQLKFRRGRILQQRFNDSAAAVTAFREVLTLIPDHEPARHALQGYLEDPERQLAVIEVLEPIYERTADLGRLVEVQNIKLSRQKTPATRVPLLLRIGDLQQKLGVSDAAWDAYSRAFAEEPGSPAARDALETLASTFNQWGPLVKLYEGALRKKLPATLERELLLVIAVAYDEKLDLSEKAVEYFRRAQEILPQDASALVALERLYTRNERWVELIETLRKKAELVADAAERVEIRTRIATVWEEMLGDAEEAISAWKDVVAETPDDLGALRALDRLYLGRKDFRELADNLQQQLQLTAVVSERVGLLVRLGQLRELELGQSAAAVDTYRLVLAEEPEHPDAIAALSRILPDRELELQVAQLLEPVFRARADYHNLVAVQEVMARHATNPEEKVAMLAQIAEGYEIGLDSPERAYDALGRALREDPMQPDIQAQIERLARSLGRMEDLVERYQTLVAAVVEPDLRNAIFHKIARLCEVELHRDEEAAVAYAAALDAYPRDLGAANALETIYLRSGDYARLVGLLLRKADIVAAPAEKKDLYYKAAQLYEEVLENQEKAIEVYRGVLAVDDADSVALDNLERIYIRLSMWGELKDVYARKAQLAATPAERKQMLFVLGQVHDRELHNPERAIETYTSILDIDPDDYDAAQALDRLYQHTERWYDLLAILERQTELAHAPQEVVSLRFRIGELWRQHLNDLSHAVEAYRQVLAMDPTHEPTLRALEGLMAGTQEPVLAAEVLEPIYESASEWDRVVGVYEVMAAHAESPARRVERLRRIAEIEERRLSHQGAAFEAYGRALQADPGNAEVVAHLERLAAETNGWQRLAQLYSQELARPTESRSGEPGALAVEPGQRVELLLRLARLHEEETNEQASAISDYQSVLRLEPENRAALTALDRLFVREQRWQELAEVVLKEVAIAPTDDDTVDLTFRLAQIHELALGDTVKAIAAYRDVLIADPGHGETRAALERMFVGGSHQGEIADVLEPLYRQNEEWENLAQIYEVQLGQVTSVDGRQILLRRLAEMAEQKLVDQIAAFGWWAQSAKEDPSSPHALDELLRLVRSTHQWDEYVATMFEAAGATDIAPPVRREVRLRLAAVFENDLRDLERAEKVLVQTIAEDDRDGVALASLDRIYVAQSMYENLAAVLRQRIAISDDTGDIVALHLRLGRVNAEALDDAEGAIASYLAVLEHESRSREALDALERLYFRGEQWTELYGIYEKLVDVSQSDSDLAACYTRMAKIAADVLADRAKAVDLWGRVLDLRGDDAIALAGLADLHEYAGEWKELTEVLDRLVVATAEPEQRIPVYKRLGRVWGEKLSRERNALESWQKVLEIDSQDVDALRAIVDNYRSAGAWEELSEALRRLIGVAQLGENRIGPPELKELYSQLGELEGETLMRTQEAIEAWREVLEIDAEDFRALAALEKLFIQEARWEDAVDILERRALALASPEEQVDVLMQAAALWADKIGDGGSAAGVYERILQIDASNQPASVELEQLYRQRKSWMKLVDLLLARTEFVGESTTRITLLVQVAETYEQQLGDRESAFVTLQAAFREDYSNNQVARELERLATAIGRWNELISDYTQVVQGIEDPKQAADLWVKIARWYDSALGHLDYAVTSARQALGLDPAHIDALSALEDFYRKQKKWQDLVSVLSKHADLEQDPAKKVDLLLALADTYETQIGDTAQATFAYQRALDTDERCLDAITALERLYRRTQAWDRLVDVLAKKALVVDDTELAVKLRLQVGELWEDRLGDNDRAVESYKEVLSVDPQNLAALKALDSLYQKTGNMEAYLENLEHQLEVSSPEGDRVEIYQRMATVWEEQFSKTDRAAEVLEKILLVDDRNQKAYRDLERIYALDKKWDNLVDTYRKHILSTHDQKERIDLYTQTGRVLENELRDLDRAIEAYNDALNFEPDHVAALSGLGRLYEETEQWERAVEIMRRLVALSSDLKERVDLNYRLGKIHDEHLRAPEAAEEFLVEALAQDATHVPSMLSLLALYKRRGDWVKAAQLMARAEANTANPLEKTRLLQEAAKIYLEKLGDEDMATKLFARVIELDPEYVEAAEPLSELYAKRKEWGPLVPLMETLARKAGKKTNREMTQLYHRLARAADHVGDSEKALKAYKQSYDLDATYLPTLVDRAALLYRLEHWDDAFRIYQTILVHHRDSQKDDEVVDLFFRLGRIKLKLGERPKAINMFEKALEIQSGHRPTLNALTEIYSEASDWEAVIKQKRALLAGSHDVDEKFAINEQVAAIYKDKLGNPQKAIASHLEALELRPSSRQLLHSLLDLFSETKQWKKAIEILTKLADLEQGKLKARFLVAAGNIANYELHSTDDAVEFLNQALDADPDDLKAFERIDKIMTAKKDWRNQERSYRRMIKRLGAQPGPEKRDTQIALWHALGEIYRSRLKDYKAATAAFEVAVSLNQGDLRRRQILAELYQLSGPESYDKAIGELRFLVKNTPELADAAPYLKTLRGLYLEMQLHDRAWCVAAVLASLRKADAEEQQFFEQYRVKGFTRARARLTEELWQRNIYHPDEDRFVSHIFASVSMAVAAAYAKEHKDWGLKRKDKRDVPNDQLLFSKVFSYLVQVMGVPQPELYLRPESPGELDMANAREKAQLTPSFVVGASLLQGRPEKELAYITAKKLAWMRPEHFVRWPTVVPTLSQLRVVFLAALRLAHPAFSVKPELAQPVTQYLDFLRKLIPAQMLEQLTIVVQRFIAAKGEADINRWATAVDFTSTRTGFLMCNDLEVATRLVQNEPIAVGSAEPKDKIRDLLQWSISDEYFAVREHLGFTIA
jgi:tetratricopeptide (TPR) repeat protein